MILLNEKIIIKYLNNSKTFTDYENQYNNLKINVNIFINKLRSRVFKRKLQFKKLLNIIKYRNLIKHKPCNDEDLYTLDMYNTNNKNIYLIDLNLNKKWWFSIETINKLLSNNLSHFDTETYDIICKEPVNPYTNKKLNEGQLISIYEQLNKYNVNNRLFSLYKFTGFNLDKFLLMYNDDIINYSFKYKLEDIDNDGLRIIFNNILYLYKIKYVNINRIDLQNKFLKDSLLILIKKCMFTYNTNQTELLKSFIDNNKQIIRKASRNYNTTCDLDSWSSSDELSDTEEMIIDTIEII